MKLSINKLNAIVWCDDLYITASNSDAGCLLQIQSTAGGDVSGDVIEIIHDVTDDSTASRDYT